MNSDKICQTVSQFTILYALVESVPFKCTIPCRKKLLFIVYSAFCRIKMLSLSRCSNGEIAGIAHQLSVAWFAMDTNV